MLGVNVVNLQTLHAALACCSKPLVEGVQVRQAELIVHVFVAEEALPLEKLHIRLGVDLRYNLVKIVEVSLAGLGERGCEVHKRCR